METTERCEQIARQLGEIHKRMKRMQSLMLREYDISLLEYHILMLAARTRDIRQNEIAGALDVDKALVSRQIRTMEQKGLLSCDADPGCRRKKTICLSERALALIPQLEQAHRRGLERAFDGISEPQLGQLQFILEGLVSKL